MSADWAFDDDGGGCLVGVEDSDFVVVGESAVVGFVGDGEFVVVGGCVAGDGACSGDGGLAVCFGD